MNEASCYFLYCFLDLGEPRKLCKQPKGSKAQGQGRGLHDPNTSPRGWLAGWLAEPPLTPKLHRSAADLQKTIQKIKIFEHQV